MSFEEEFPSLIWSRHGDESSGWSDEGIAECCRDKQRVREVLDSHIEGAEEQYQFDVVTSLKAIKEALGL